MIIITHKLAQGSFVPQLHIGRNKSFPTVRGQGMKVHISVATLTSPPPPSPNSLQSSI